jgi:hypothetical protein
LLRRRVDRGILDMDLVNVRTAIRSNSSASHSSSCAERTTCNDDVVTGTHDRFRIARRDSQAVKSALDTVISMNERSDSEAANLEHTEGRAGCALDRRGHCGKQIQASATGGSHEEIWPDATAPDSLLLVKT